MTRNDVHKEPQLVCVKRLPFKDDDRLTGAFRAAENTTRGYTLSRDVQDCIDAALRREKRSEE